MGYYFSVLIKIFISFIQAVGAHLSLSQAGIFFLAIPVSYSFMAYSLAILQKKFAFEVMPAFGLGLFFTFLLGLVLSYLYIRVSRESFTVLTAASIVGFEAFLKSFSGLTGGVLGISGIMRPSFMKSLFAIVVVSGIIMLATMLMEYLIFKAPLGRQIRGMKESETLLESLSVSSAKVSRILITLATVLSGFAGGLEILRVQFLDPIFGGFPNLILIASIAILAQQPRVRTLFFSTLFVVLLPEILRFFNFHPSQMGHMRMLVYSGMLVVLIRNLSGKFKTNSRIV